MPGETTILFNFSHGHLSGSITIGSLEILSSYAYILPPPAFKLLNADFPETPNPNNPISLFSMFFGIIILISISELISQ